jgi:alkylhydroperoxidase/carboxymuconolactone decarboxylase family protein YurZ
VFDTDDNIKGHGMSFGDHGTWPADGWRCLGIWIGNPTGRTADDVLSQRVRSLVTVAVAAALRRERETELELERALRHGCTPEEVRALIKHVATRADAPVGAEAAVVAERVLGRRTAD